MSAWEDDFTPHARDLAEDRGYVQSEDLFRPLPPAILDLDKFRAEITAANDDARTHTDCGVEECGWRRCEDCNERMACTGPEPRACGTTCADCPCSCTTCLRVRDDLRAELMERIAKEEG